MDRLPLFLVLVVGAVLGAGAWYSSSKRASRERALPSAARRAGLDFSEDDRFHCTAVAFPLLRAGEGRLVENLMWRPAADPPPVTVFDYSYYDEYKDKNGQVHKSWKHFSCALVRHDGGFPDLRVTKEGLVDKATHVLGTGDIDFESEEFNRTFVVRADDRRFASAFIDPQMMEILLKTGGEVALETKGRFLLLWSDPLDPDVMPRFLNLAEDVLAHVPPAVWELYPRLPDSGMADTYPHDAAAGDRGAHLLDVTRPFAAGPSLLHPDESWDPTPGVDHDLDGHEVEPVLEDPWRDQPPPPPTD